MTSSTGQQLVKVGDQLNRAAAGGSRRLAQQGNSWWKSATGSTGQQLVVVAGTQGSEVQRRASKLPTEEVTRTGNARYTETYRVSGKMFTQEMLKTQSLAGFA